MGLHTGVKPGAELAAAAQTAEERGMEVELVDRNIRTTLLRVWRKTGFWNKMKVMASLFGSLFEKQELDESELAKLRESDTLSSMLDEMGEMLPSVKQILVDERDTYMAYHIRNAPGEKILAVVGAAHLPGIIRLLQGEEISAETIAEISVIPPKTTLSKMIPWLIPGIVVALFIGGFFFGKRSDNNHNLRRTVGYGVASVFEIIIICEIFFKNFDYFLFRPVNDFFGRIIGFFNWHFSSKNFDFKVREL